VLQDKLFGSERKSRAVGIARQRELENMAKSSCAMVASEPAPAAQPSFNTQPRDSGSRSTVVEHGRRYYAPTKNPAAGADAGDHSQSEKGVNVTVLGRIGRYPEVKRTQGGGLLAKFSVATNESYKDPSGNWQKKTEWHRIVAWGELAQSVCKLLRKGLQVYVEGRLTTREWTDRQNNKRTSVEVSAKEISFLDIAEKGIVHRP
jgi:single-strand DNA-binding protein